MSPRGGMSLNSSLPNFKSLLVPFGGFSEASDRSKAAKASAGPGRNLPRMAGSLTAPANLVSASPAARLRNYLASKVTRKRLNVGPSYRPDKTSGSPGEEAEPDSGRAGDSSGSRELAEALETVLLVSALEDYIFDRHGPGKEKSNEGEATSSEPAARVRLNCKQPPPEAKAHAKSDLNDSRPEPAGAYSPPAVPLDPPANPPPLQGSSTPANAASQPEKPERRKQMVRIFYNGHELTTKESVVQVLVHNAKKSGPHEELSRYIRRSRRTVGSRFLASIQENSSSGEDASARRKTHAHNFFCGSIWGKVHHMTFELIPDATSPREAKDSAREEEPSVEPPVMIVSSDMDWLVQCHLRILPTIEGIYASGSKSDMAVDASSSQEQDPSNDVTADETFTTMLKLLSAFHNISLYSRAMNFEVETSSVDEDFHCNALTSAWLKGNVFSGISVMRGPKFVQVMSSNLSLLWLKDVRKDGDQMLKLTLTIPWAASASDVDLQRNQADSEAAGVVVLRVVPRWGGDPELPVRVVAGTGDFELEVKKGGIKVQTTGKAPKVTRVPPKASFHRRKHTTDASLEVYMELEEERDAVSRCDVLLPMAAPESWAHWLGLGPLRVSFVSLASRHLSAAYLRRRYAYDGFNTIRALELGSGCGVVGLVAAAHGAEVIKLDFASEQDCKDFAEKYGAVDLLLASDVLYEHQLVAKFLRSATVLTCDELILAVELRPCGVDLKDAILSDAPRYGFDATDVTDKVKMWVTPWSRASTSESSVSSLKIPPLEERHRLFLLKRALKGTKSPGKMEAEQMSKVKSHQPWKEVGEKEWYQRSLHFWLKQDATDAGVLDGHVDTSPLDLKESADFLDALRCQRFPGKFSSALDCGAGVGRITQGLLLDRVTDAVDLLEPCGHLLQEARERLAQTKARHFLELSWVDQRDSSLCRSEAALCQVFAQAGLKILDKKPQEEWPEKLLPVMMSALLRQLSDPLAVCTGIDSEARVYLDPIVAMSSKPKFYRLDLVNLGELFDPDVPFSEWCKKCQWAGNEGFGNSRLQDHAPNLTPLEHTERICGTLLYINLSGAGIVWLSLALICYCCGWYHPARSFTMYTLMPVGIWLLIYILYDRSKDSRYGIHHKNQHKYLHLKYVWPVELHPNPPADATNPSPASTAPKGPLIFCIVPHGVIPLGIDYAMFDKLGAGRCNWVAAPILFKLPFFRSYLERVGAMPANAGNIRAALARNENVALVLDGVAGMFQATTHRQEVAYLLKRKGIVKIALQSGASLVPVYGFGHSELWTKLLDPFGFLERISIALDISLVPFFGLGGWPLGPTNRVPLAMVFGQPLECPQKADPTQCEIDCYHTLLLDAFKETFDKHKAAYGWSQKTLMIV
eukprot:symbB.v1.2.016873.t3/scaffold1300.1/size126151/10